MVRPLDPVGRVVVVDPNDEVVSHGLGLLQHVDMAHVEEIEGAVDVDDLVIGTRALGGSRELHDLVCRRHELREAGVGRSLGVGGEGEAVDLLVLGDVFGVLHVVLLRHQQHSPHQVRRRHSLRARHHLELAGLLNELVAVSSISGGDEIVSVNTKVDIVFLENLELGLVRSSRNNLVDPLAGRHRLVPLLFVHDGRTLVLEDIGIRVDADDEVVAEALGLTEGVGMAVVHHVETPVRPHSHLSRLLELSLLHLLDARLRGRALVGRRQRR
mmetsp:Transcript_9377/g.16050  ORF Transcript_9377/g.16050 Transcript_9377/m.16050 type:complete len:271 (+) Transcript_9377:383-1195(+)